MTDQDPTQPYQPPTPAAAPATPPPAAPAAPPAAPSGPAPAGPEFAAPVGTTPVTQPAARKTGRSPVKWAVAGLVVVLVAGVAAGATMMLTSNTATAASAVEKWAPADAVSYYEVRLDLPGAQSAELAEFMSAFPGFDDQAAFPAKLGEIGDRIVRGATEGKHDYQTEIAPWFGGQIGVSQGAPPDPGSGSVLPEMLAAITITDTAKATEWLTAFASESGATTVTQDHNGTTITVVQPGSELGGMIDTQYGYAVVEGAILAGDVPSIEAALDANGANGLATNAEFQAAKAALPADHLAFGWTDVRDSFGSLFESMDGLDDSGMLEAAGRVYTQVLPEWTAGEVRAEDGRLVFESVVPHSTTLGETSNRVDPIAAMAPADTVFLATGSDVGVRLQAMRDLFAAEPAFADIVDQVDQALGIVGGFDAATGWLGDAGVAITKQGDLFDGGIIIEPADAAAAERLFTSLRSLIQVGAGGVLQFEQEDHNGTTIVSVDLTQLAGMGAEMGGLPPGALPSELKLAWAVDDDVVVIGVGTQFVKDVLDARTGDSLADQARYSAIIDAAGAENAGVFWLDVAAIRDTVRSLLPDEVAGEYDRDLAPYLEPLDAFGGVTIVGSDLDRGKMYLTVTE